MSRNSPDRLPRPDVRTNTVRAIIGSQDLEAVRNTEGFNISINRIVANPAQPRQIYDEEKEAELLSSVREHGIIQPLIVRKIEGSKYQIVAGERRYRAALAAGLEQLPVVVKEYSDEQSRVVSILENLQRADLDPRDEQKFFQQLQNDHNMSTQDIASMLHKSRGYVRNRLEGKLDKLQPTLANPDPITNSENNNNLASQANLSPTANPKPARSYRPLKFNPAVFTRFARTLNDHLQIFDEKDIKSETREQLVQSVEESIEALLELRRKLKKEEIQETSELSF